MALAGNYRSHNEGAYPWLLAGIAALSVVGLLASTGGHFRFGTIGGQAGENPRQPRMEVAPGFQETVGGRLALDTRIRPAPHEDQNVMIGGTP